MPLLSLNPGFSGAVHALEGMAQIAAPVAGPQYPGPLLPGRVVADMAGVAALQIGHPMTLLVPVEADDPPRYTASACAFGQSSSSPKGK